MIDILLAVIFFIVGVQFFRKKWLFLIAGFNTLSKSKKESYNVNLLTKIMGIFCLIMVIIYLLDYMFPQKSSILTISILTLIVTLAFLVNSPLLKK